MKKIGQIEDPDNKAIILEVFDVSEKEDENFVVETIEKEKVK